MRILCRHGHIALFPRTASDVARFSNFFGVTLKRERDYYTFAGLYGAEDYSLLGRPFLNLPAITTYAGLPWEVMRENDFVYNIELGIIVPKLTIVGVVELPLVGFFYRSGGSLIQPGARTLLGRQILSYSGEFFDNGFSLNISEFDYE